MTVSSNIPYASALSPEYALLGLLALQPGHGYELYQRLVGELGQIWHISLSQTYNILNRLEGRGWIAGTMLEQAKLPARRHFDLTASGRSRFEEWLHAPTGSSVRAIRVEFITRLYFIHLLAPAVTASVIDAQFEAVGLSLARLEQLLAGLPDDQQFNRLGVELRVRQLVSIRDWLVECRARLVTAG